MWFLDQLQGDSSYNIPFALRLEGVLNEGALEQALSAIVSRHEVLRTAPDAGRESGAGDPVCRQLQAGAS